jgi:hypothetical protein
MLPSACGDCGCTVCVCPAPCRECVREAELATAPVKIETGDNMKKDHGKDPWHLAPWDAFQAIVRVLAFGAAKYSERGWEEGMAWSRFYSACMRHLTDWFHQRDKGKGPGRDADTGYSDLWHAGCCVCFLIAYEMRGMRTHDDRPALPASK